MGILAALAGICVALLGLVLSCCWFWPSRPEIPPLPRMRPAPEAAVAGVILVRDANKVEVRTSAGGGWRAVDPASELATRAGEHSWTVQPTSDGLAVGSVKAPGRQVRLVPWGDPPHGEFQLGGRPYRGSLLVVKEDDNTLTAINELLLEDYLRSVVACEMYSYWDLQALMAQAVAARTYALHRLTRVEGRNVLTGTDMAYRGAEAESERVNRAVEATAGVVMTYGGKLFPAYFHNTCGGHTADAAKVFGGKSILPLSGVECGWCGQSPHFTWTAQIPAADIAAALAPFGVKRVDGLKPLEAEPDGRATAILVNRRKKIPAADFRIAVGAEKLRSTAFRVEKRGSEFVFQGKGWGHGVGLCQWGAAGLAEGGPSWEEILAHYYPGAVLQRAY